MTGMKISASEGLVCPNCHTLNNPNSEICISCGIHFQVYDEVKQELSQRVNERQDQFLKTIHEEAQQKLIKDQKVLHKDFVKQLIILLLVGIALVPIIWGSLKILQHQEIEQQQFLETNYQKGVNCLATMDYQCANDYFQKVYAKDKSYQDCLKLLLTSKFGIAEDYFKNGQISKSIDILNTIVSLDTQNIQALKLLDNYYKFLGAGFKDQGSWQKAIDEYSNALKAMPDDFAARNAINEIYTLWIKEVSAKGDRFSAWQLNRQQDTFNNK
jgi:tetratricopeptide (TPR) repeat protein